MNYDVSSRTFNKIEDSGLLIGGANYLINSNECGKYRCDYIARYIGPIMSVPPQKTLWMYLTELITGGEQPVRIGDYFEKIYERRKKCTISAPYTKWTPVEIPEWDLRDIIPRWVPVRQNTYNFTKTSAFVPIDHYALSDDNQKMFVYYLGRDGQHISSDTSPDEVKTTVSQIILTALRANPALHKLSEDILGRITDYVSLDYGKGVKTKKRIKKRKN